MGDTQRGKAARELIDTYNQVSESPMSRDVLRGFLANQWPELHDAIHQLGRVYDVLVILPSTDDTGEGGAHGEGSEDGREEARGQA